MRAANYLPLVRKTLELANSCVLLYKSMDDKRKREILDTVYSNFLLDGKNLTPVCRVSCRVKPCNHTSIEGRDA